MTVVIEMDEVHARALAFVLAHRIRSVGADNNAPIVNILRLLHARLSETPVEEIVVVDNG